MARSEKLDNFYFFVGNGTPDARLNDEIKFYDDIVVGDFQDTYENLPTKTKFVYKVAVDQCHEEVNSYYMIDSDVIVGQWLCIFITFAGGNV